ncbi:MAG: DNRLRE domain-containing protein [Planctomycetes bacterium]|nr:DNRLRE domain-containing protein [Planctomycetota bacterium]
MRQCHWLIMLLMLGVCGQTLGGTLEYQTGFSGDDTYATSSTNDYNYSYAYAVPSNAGTYTFLRFPISVPKGATITSAKLVVNASYTSTTAGASRIRLIDEDDCESFTTSPFSLSVTQDYVDWSIAANSWTADQWYDSADISDLVQDFIDRANYDYGCAIGLRLEYVSGSYKKLASWDKTDHTLGPKLQITYTGGEAVITMHMADPEVRVAQKVYCELVNVGASDTLQVLLDEEEVYTKEGPLEDEEIFVADYTELEADEHTLTVNIVDTSETVRGTASRTWTTLHNGIPDVGIDENNAICVDGVPFFPVTPWLLNKSRFEYPIAGTINTLMAEGWYATHNLDSWKDYLEAGEGEGWYVVGPIRWDGFNETTPALSDTDKMADYVEATRSGYPALFAWAWDDEPELGGENKHFETRNWTELTHSLDTNHPTYVNFTGYVFTSMPGGVDTIKKYCYLYDKDQYGKNCLVADILSIDYYCYEYATKFAWCDLEDAMLALDRLRDWNRNLAPVMSYIESTDIRAPDDPTLTWPWSPGPTPAELHNLIWLTVIHGAKGISWYHYNTETPAENIAVMEQFLEDITTLTPVVLGPEETDYEVTTNLAYGGRVDHMVRQYGDDLWIFAGEVLSATGETVTFNASFLEDGDTVVVYGEDRTIEAEDGYFVDDFGPLAIHIYVLDTNPPAEPVDVQYQIAASADDMDCNAWNGSTTGEYIHWPYGSDGRRAFLRWELDIPAGSTINSAYVQVKANQAYSTAGTVRLQAIDDDDCPAFTSSLPYAWSVDSNYVDWELGQWSADTWYDSPDLTDVVQAVVDMQGYGSGNYFGLRAAWVSGSFRRVWTYDHASTDAPVLVVNYTPGGE